MRFWSGEQLFQIADNKGLNFYRNLFSTSTNLTIAIATAQSMTYSKNEVGGDFCQLYFYTAK